VFAIIYKEYIYKFSDGFNLKCTVLVSESVSADDFTKSTGIGNIGKKWYWYTSNFYMS